MVLIFKYLKKIQGGEIMDKKKLRSIIVLHGDTNGDLAKEIGISYQRFSEKLNERKGAEFTQSEILKIKNRYKLSCEEIDEIFFNSKVS